MKTANGYFATIMILDGYLVIEIIFSTKNRVANLVRAINAITDSAYTKVPSKTI